MESINNLSWEATSDANWVQISPSTGVGDSDISITVENATGRSTDLSAEVTFRCTSCKQLTGTSIIKKVNVCRCACDCDAFTYFNKIYDDTEGHTIPEEGLQANTEIATYDMISRCNKNAIKAFIFDVIDGELTNKRMLDVGDNSIKLKEAIPYNTDMENQKRYKIHIIFDNGEPYCQAYEIVQDALKCDCGTAILSLEWIDFTTIPQTGLPKNTLLFRYEAKEHCPVDDSHLNGKISYGGSSYSTFIDIANGEGRLHYAIGKNTGFTDRDIKVTVSYVGNSGEEVTCNSNKYTQIGCKCETALIVENIRIYNDCISTFGVESSQCIGSYTFRSNSECPSVITATLYTDNVSYNLVCESSKFCLNANDSIPENITKVTNYFSLDVFYNGELCRRIENIPQYGVKCNCDDLIGDGTRLVSFYFDDANNKIPKEGLTAGTVFGQIKFVNTECETGCTKIEEVNGYNINFRYEETIDGSGIYNIILINEIPEIDDVSPVEYSFKISYYINNKWHECYTIPVIQKGLACSCDTIKVYPDDAEDFVEFPRSGTNGKWVEFASGDTGLYNKNGELVDVCGSLKATTTSYLYEEGVRTVATAYHDDKAYKFSFLAKVPQTQGNTTETGQATLIFTDKDGNENECRDIAFGLKVSPNACDCNKNIVIKSTRIVPCAGITLNSSYVLSGETNSIDDYVFAKIVYTYDVLQNDVKIGEIETTEEFEIKSSSIVKGTWTDDAFEENPSGNDLALKVVFMDDVIEYVKVDNFIVQPVVGNVDLQEVENLINKVSCKNTRETPTLPTQQPKKNVFRIFIEVTKRNDTGAERVVGKLRLFHVCNPSFEIEGEYTCESYIEGSGWVCYNDLLKEIRQYPCPQCNCDYVSGHTIEVELKFPSTAVTHDKIEEKISNFGELPECAVYYLDVDSSGNPQPPGWEKELGWCKVTLDRRDVVDGGWYIIAEFLDNEHHKDRTTAVTVYFGYYNANHEFQYCGDMEVNIKDEECSCDVMEYIGVGDYDSTTGIYYIQVDIGRTTAQRFIFLKDVSETSGYTIDCIKFGIVNQDDGGVYHGSGFTASINTDLNRVDVTIDEENFVTGQTITVFGRINDTVCDETVDVEIRKEMCKCSDFINNSFYDIVTSVTYSLDSQATYNHKFAYYENKCGYATIFVIDSNNQKHKITDIGGISEFNYIVPPATATMSTGDLRIVFNTFKDVEMERETNLAVCLTDANGTPIEIDGEECCNLITIVETCPCLGCGGLNYDFAPSDKITDITPTNDTTRYDIVTINDLTEVQKKCYGIVAKSSSSSGGAAIIPPESIRIENTGISGRVKITAIVKKISTSQENPTFDISIMDTIKDIECKVLTIPFVVHGTN